MRGAAQAGTRASACENVERTAPLQGRVHKEAVAVGLTISTSTIGGADVVHCAGEIDVATAAQLRDVVQELFAGGSRAVALDMTEVTFMDSTGLGVVVGRLKTLRRAGGAMTIAVTAPRVRRVFEITGLDKVFVLHETPQDAATAAAGAVAETAE